MRISFHRLSVISSHSKKIPGSSFPELSATGPQSHKSKRNQIMCPNSPSISDRTQLLFPTGHTHTHTFQCSPAFLTHQLLHSGKVMVLVILKFWSEVKVDIQVTITVTKIYQKEQRRVICWNISSLLYVSQFHVLSSVQFSHSVMSDSLRPPESQHARPPCLGDKQITGHVTIDSGEKQG